ncbi:Epsin-3, clathrin recruitment and traffic between the Golgi and endosome [Friedmanniomyces endolithicus]|uniref:Epsin-3, clathrin recruitment and traffic between the Golgi and endosome n=1 Tax=Friedmanniomyces endolithicus TaxID=329885 RepID=A0AAN6FHS2_9PEZI|nr:Epsin-3, clathrin recruitment and traffic between the Golgi and endosome [Friedmanniomyces endolithicus]KAK0318662.1 Epsin-3, clathrin recruitment and traffic between the Golgi and endosome [Friedmanniomyces endolithicus]KAK0982389.1 Epsin-3, clathrin recruitment and traffic between the Golgi and endosome [Friedmanniomyces endolithicus]
MAAAWDLNSIKEQVAGLSLYDYGQPSLAYEPHADVYTSQQLNEIMPMIYKRFTEKSAEEWRQIYKALQLMEFLVKNGSERVIDDARSHLSLLKMLRQFHYIDLNGKDQGMNVRNRSKELTDLLSDVEKIRSERKKARATRNKYSGHEGGATLGLGGSSSGSRYGGFGSETGGASEYSGGYGASTRGVYGDGGGFGGETHEDYDENGRRGGAERFDEYDEGDDVSAQTTPGRRKADAAPAARRTPKKQPPKPKEPEVDLFEFGDDPPEPSQAAPATSNMSSILTPPPSNLAGADDDDFDDFQSAAPATATSAVPSLPKPNYSSFTMPTNTASSIPSTQFAQPSPQPGTQKASYNNLFSTTSPPPSGSGTPVANYSAFSPPPTQAQPKPAGYQPTGPNYFTSVPIQPSQQQQPGFMGMTSTAASVGSTGGIGAKKPAGGAGGGDAFAGLLGGAVKKSGTPTQKGLTIADMAKQKTQAGLYGANALAPTSGAGGAAKMGSGSSGMDDLLG